VQVERGGRYVVLKSCRDYVQKLKSRYNYQCWMEKTFLFYKMK